MLETSKKLFRESGEVGFLVSKLIEERPNDPLIAMIASKTAELTTTGMAGMDKQREFTGRLEKLLNSVVPNEQ